MLLRVHKAIARIDVQLIFIGERSARIQLIRVVRILHHQLTNTARLQLPAAFINFFEIQFCSFSCKKLNIVNIFSIIGQFVSSGSPNRKIKKHQISAFFILYSHFNIYQMATCLASCDRIVCFVFLLIHRAKIRKRTLNFEH